MAEIPWPNIWGQVASQLDEFWRDGLGAHVTEDIVRFVSVRCLVSHSVDPERIEIEWRRPKARDAVDLVVKQSPAAAIEFKYPREPRPKNAAWTTHLGEVLRDYYRLAHMPMEFEERLCVQLLPAPFQAYLENFAKSYSFVLPHEGLTELRADEINTLPQTVRQPLASWLKDDPVPIRASSLGSYAVGDGLLLAVHHVERAHP